MLCIYQVSHIFGELINIFTLSVVLFTLKKKLSYDYIFSMMKSKNEIQAVFFLSDQVITHSYLKH